MAARNEIFQVFRIGGNVMKRTKRICEIKGTLSKPQQEWDHIGGAPCIMYAQLCEDREMRFEVAQTLVQSTQVGGHNTVPPRTHRQFHAALAH